MEELRANEQYFFTDETVRRLADALERFERPCVLCAPQVGAELEQRGRAVATLDIDERFARLRSFRRWDVCRPSHLDERFDVILCDPPFFNASLSQLFAAVRMLAHFDFARPVMISYLKRREIAILSTFAPFHLQATGICPAYNTVKECERNEIEFYANFEPD